MSTLTMAALFFLENGLHRLETHYGKYAFAIVASMSISTVGLDGARVSSLKIVFSCSLGGGGGSGRYFSVP